MRKELVLFFVTSKAMKDAKLHVVRREWLEVNTFGGVTKDGKNA